MKTKRFFTNFALYFALMFVVSAIVIYVVGLMLHGEGTFHWEMTFGLAVGIGLGLALARERE